MADDESPSTPSANAAVDAPESELNDQIRDAVSQLQSILEDADASTFQAAAYQTFVHVVSLAMHNAVAQQQQSHMLRMALTTAAANAILAAYERQTIRRRHGKCLPAHVDHILPARSTRLTATYS